MNFELGKYFFLGEKLNQEFQGMNIILAMAKSRSSRMDEVQPLDMIIRWCLQNE